MQLIHIHATKLVIQHLHHAILNTGTYGLKKKQTVVMCAISTENFNRRRLKRAKTDTCTRDYKYLWTPTMNYAGYLKVYWKDWKFYYPLCYNGDGSF